MSEVVELKNIAAESKGKGPLKPALKERLYSLLQALIPNESNTQPVIEAISTMDWPECVEILAPCWRQIPSQMRPTYVQGLWQVNVKATSLGKARLALAASVLAVDEKSAAALLHLVFSSPQELHTLFRPTLLQFWLKGPQQLRNAPFLKLRWETMEERSRLTLVENLVFAAKENGTQGQSRMNVDVRQSVVKWIESLLPKAGPSNAEKLRLLASHISDKRSSSVSKHFTPPTLQANTSEVGGGSSKSSKVVSAFTGSNPAIMASALQSQPEALAVPAVEMLSSPPDGGPIPPNRAFLQTIEPISANELNIEAVGLSSPQPQHQEEVDIVIGQALDSSPVAKELPAKPEPRTLEGSSSVEQPPVAPTMPEAGSAVVDGEIPSKSVERKTTPASPRGHQPKPTQPRSKRDSEKAGPQSVQDAAKQISELSNALGEMVERELASYEQKKASLAVHLQRAEDDNHLLQQTIEAAQIELRAVNRKLLETNDALIKKEEERDVARARITELEATVRAVRGDLEKAEEKNVTLQNELGLEREHVIKERDLARREARRVMGEQIASTLNDEVGIFREIEKTPASLDSEVFLRRVVSEMISRLETQGVLFRG